MKFLSSVTWLLVVPFITMSPMNGSAAATLIDCDRAHVSRRVLTTLGSLQQYHHTSLSCTPFIFRQRSPLPILTLRGGNIDASIHMSTSSSSQPLVAPIFDMERMKIRLDGLGQYAVICALLLNVCLNIYFNTLKHLEDEGTGSTLQREARQSKPTYLTHNLFKFYDRGMKIVKFTFILSSVFSIISSAYTAVVFTLLGLYSKAALGMGCDTNFLLFFDTTAKLRESAFDAFVISLMNFEISFLTSLIIAYKGQYRLLIIAITALCLSYSFYHWFSIITLAGRLLYSTSIPVGTAS